VEEAVFQSYVEAWKSRQEEEEASRRKRAREAERTAARLSRILVDQYGAAEVWLFGSLVRPGRFRAHSDIDLAATGLPKSAYFQLLSRLNATSAFTVDLVDLDGCAPWLADAIRREGKLLATRGEHNGSKK
jgi:predicted nucleotidyltransferase